MEVLICVWEDSDSHHRVYYFGCHPIINIFLAIAPPWEMVLRAMPTSGDLLSLL